MRLILLIFTRKFISFAIPIFKPDKVKEAGEKSRKKILEALEQCERQMQLYREAEKVARIGSWEWEKGSGKINVTDNFFTVHGMDRQEIDLGQLPDLYEDGSDKLVREALDRLVENGEGFNLQLKIQRVSDGESHWVRSRGEPKRNHDGEMVGIKGTVQDIDGSVRKSEDLKKSSSIIQNQNKRLQNFTYMISHNLRSHSSNLTSIADFLGRTDSDEERGEFIQFLNETTANLEDTLTELHDIIRIQDRTNLHRNKVSLKESVDSVQSVLRNEIIRTKASIKTDLKRDEIKHVRTYLDSILLNLLSNAIKYRHPDRKPAITVRSYQSRDGDDVLEVEDNGVGMDLDRVKDKLFNLYQTFHHHPDARGIGLFITRSQVEALGGRIDVESEEDKGTIFRVTF